jgi:hypothetical protein
MLYAVALLLLLPAGVRAQDSTMRHQHGAAIDTNRIGVMSPAVAQQRLRLLGYTDVAVVERARTAVHANASKGGRAVAVRLDPRSGKVTEVPGRLERRPEGLRVVTPAGAAVSPPE